VPYTADISCARQQPQGPGTAPRMAQFKRLSAACPPSAMSLPVRRRRRVDHGARVPPGAPLLHTRLRPYRPLNPGFMGCSGLVALGGSQIYAGRNSSSSRELSSLHFQYTDCWISSPPMCCSDGPRR
jgi:hypothetical protein